MRIETESYVLTTYICYKNYVSLKDSHSPDEYAARADAIRKTSGWITNIFGIRTSINMYTVRCYGFPLP